MVNVFRRFMLVTAFFIALFIFLVGLYAGFLLDSYRVKDTSGQLSDLQLDTESFVVERSFLDAFHVSDCSILNERMGVLGEDLSELGNALARFDAKKLSHGEAYEQLRRKYFLLEI